MSTEQGGHHRGTPGGEAEDARGRQTAGPVAGQDPSSSQATEKGPHPTPPAEEAAKQSPVGPTPPADDGGSDERSEEARDAAPVEHDIDALLNERDEYLELAKRTKADFENYRRRMASEVQAATARGKAELIRQVVPVLDDLERAIEAAGLDPEGDSDDGLAHGVLLVFRGLRETLTRNGIEVVDPKGEKFDPNLHEALSTQPLDGAESGTVVEVMQKGYRLDDQLVRPARVVVAE